KFGDYPVDGAPSFLARIDSAGTPAYGIAIVKDSSIAFDALATDPAGNAYATGIMYQAADLGAGKVDVGEPSAFVARYDASGAATLSRAIHGISATGRAIAATSSGFVVAGTHNYDLDVDGLEATASGEPRTFVLRFDAAGKGQSLLSIGSTNDFDGSSATPI